jgi:REP element-mobilizing transposase RayT
MAQSLSNVLIHLVFSTKNRRNWIEVGIEEELFKYVSGTYGELNCPAHKVGASDDHIHIACSLSRTVSISQLVEDIETGSSKWMKTKGTGIPSFVGRTAMVRFRLGNRSLRIYADTLAISASTIGR